MLTKEQLNSVAGMSSRDAAAALGVGKSTINDARARHGMRRPLPEPAKVVERTGLKILALDLETSPNVAHVWGLWNQNVSIKQLLESTQVICFGARWYGEEEVIFGSVHHDGQQAMLQKVYDLLDEADAVMGWNSKGFDSKHLNREFLEAGMLPPSPWKELDLMLAVKKVFRFPSNKLDYVAQRLGVGAKVQHSGHELWIRCMAGEEAAWEEMKEYQVQDVDLLIDLYDKLKPWIKTHPAAPLYEGLEVGCPVCGSSNLTRQGFAHTASSSFQRFVCGECGAWSRGSSRVASTSLRQIA